MLLYCSFPLSLRLIWLVYTVSMLQATITIKVINFLLLFLFNNVLNIILSHSIKYCLTFT